MNGVVGVAIVDTITAKSLLLIAFAVLFFCCRRGEMGNQKLNDSKL